MKKIIKMFFVSLAIISIVGFTFLLIQKIFFKSNIPSVGGFSYVQVITGSMEPTYKINDFVLIKKTKNVKKNDVIIYAEENYYVTHRLIEINHDNYITKGDANNTSEIISKDQVIGKVIYHSSFVSTIINILKNPITLILIGLVVILSSSIGGTNEKESKIAEKN